MNNLLAVFFGAGFGGALRYLVSVLIVREAPTGFPTATLLINLLGCALIGYVGTFFANLSPHREVLRLAIAVGILGGFTTFSSFGRETFELITHGRWSIAITYVLLSNVGGIALVFAGHAVARLSLATAAG